MSSTTFHIVALVWFFGCGFILLKFPVSSYRIMTLGRKPQPENLKLAKIVGYMGIGLGTLLLIEMAFGLLK